MNIKAEQWVTWIATTCVAAMGLAAFAFSTFETKENVKELKGDVSSRLQRIEDKLDRLGERRDKNGLRFRD